MIKFRSILWLRGLLAGVFLLAAGCASLSSKKSPALCREKLAAMDVAIQEAIAAKDCPGGVLWVEHAGRSYHKAYGQRALVPKAEAMTPDTIFDAASLTKAIATAPAIMLLQERRQVNIYGKVRDYIPEFTGAGKEAITIRQLLTHTSGLRSGLDVRTNWQGQAEAIRLICESRLVNPPGEVFRYSDLNFILLGEIVQRVTHQSLAQFVATNLYAPLGMPDTGYLPPKWKRSRIAPTEVVDGQLLRGVVHDTTARRMGGVAGHAGVFTTAEDLARFARMMLYGGAQNGLRILNPSSIQLMTTVQTSENIEVKRGLGWDIDSEYSAPRGDLLSSRSYGHTGWTGTSLWIDPAAQTFVIFLSNRVHPYGQGNVTELRRKLGTLAAEAVRGN